ncbi:MAG: glutamine--fructose-6-phosphate transaminase (isomerizing) [Deltaproteobacteria bacterium]|nr:glutamine--fructose-6-phosphate transaminase (isomerizing) [Deltaproteobacteria bacterium]
MCGIIGYVGHEECAPIILEGLRRLEYRGYDSAGIAVHDGQALRVRRAAGKLSVLGDLLAREPLRGTVGIGHTRWATHGKPVEHNAHPHVSGGIAVVHNGIIENHVELKRRLQAEGRVFSSDTDTEIVAHLVDLATQRGLSLFEAVRATLAELRGAYAIAVLAGNDASKIVLAKNASPLVVGKGDGVMIAASDVPALLQHTRDVIFLEDGELAEITRDGARIERLDGTPVNRPPQRVHWSMMQAERGGYKHFMLKEIHEQPRALEDTLRGRVLLEESDLEASELGVTPEAARTLKRVVFLACGTSYHAALHGRYLVESVARVPAVAELASEFRYRDPVVGEGDLVVAVSQSGETADTLAAAKEAKERGAQILAVVNVQGSAIARMAHGALYTHAGPEIGVASTKCFTAQLAALTMLALYLGRRRGALTAERAGALLTELVAVPHKMRDALADAKHVEDIARAIMHARDALFLGRGLSSAVALEGALKLKEISYVHAEGYAGGEMKHGPLALVDRNMPVVCLLPDDSTLEKMLSNVQEVRARDGNVIAVVNTEEVAQNLATHTIKVPRTAEEFTPLVTIVPLQLLSYYVADHRGTDVDQPRNLAKTVTVE